MRLHKGTLFAGVIYMGIGIGFLLEALEVWTLQISDLTVVGPLALVILGLAVVVGSLGRTGQKT
jgi:hypothetical protein